jgi:hypothetical protein
MHGTDQRDGTAEPQRAEPEEVEGEIAAVGMQGLGVRD